MTRQLVAQWMRGEALPTGAAMQALPGLLGVEASWLFPMGDKTPARPPGGTAATRSALARVQEPYGGTERRKSSGRRAGDRLAAALGTAVASEADVRALEEAGVFHVVDAIASALAAGELHMGTPKGRAFAVALLRRAGALFYESKLYDAARRLSEQADDLEAGS